MGFGTFLSSVIATLLALGLVLGLAWGALWLLRKWQGKALGIEDAAADEGRSLKFVRALPLGQRERVVLIEVGGESMLLGISAGAVTLLSHWGSDGRLLRSGDSAPSAASRNAAALAAGASASLGYPRG